VKKLIKLMVCNVLGATVFFGGMTSLHAQEPESIKEEVNIAEIKNADRLELLISELEEVDSQINECEISVKMDLESKLSDVSQIKKALVESLEKASWYAKLSIKKQIKKADELEAEIKESQIENEAKIESLKEQGKKLQLKIEKEMRAN